jgi:hypothetical protein
VGVDSNLVSLTTSTIYVFSDLKIPIYIYTDLASKIVLIVNNLNIMNIASPPHFQITFPYSPIIL